MKKFTPVLLSVFLLVVCLVCMAAVSSFYIVDDTTGEKLPFGTGGELHFDNISGMPNNVTIFLGAGDFLSHIADSTIHFTESSIDHTAIQNIGTNSHAAIDTHLADSTIHFTESSISHDNLQGASGYYNHSTINIHIDDTSIHAPIFDNLSTSTSTLWSSDYTKDYVDTHSGGSASIPTGVIWQFAGSSAPTGWLFCDGDEISRTTYDDLFAVIGETYGYGNYSTTFNLPDLRGRTAIGAGQGDGLTNRTLGESIGEESHALTESENGPHTHNVGYKGAASGTGGIDYGADDYTSSEQTESSGSGSPHNTMQPSLVINYIIKY